MELAEVWPNRPLKTRTVQYQNRNFSVQCTVCILEPCSPPRSLARPAAARAAGCGGPDPAVRRGAVRARFWFARAAGSNMEPQKPAVIILFSCELKGKKILIKAAEHEAKTCNTSIETNGQTNGEAKQSYWANTIVLHFAPNGEP